MKRIYLDNAATTPISPEVLEAMMPYLTDQFGNPSAQYREGRNAKLAIENARKQVAVCLSTHPSQIIFTSGGTEANNLALRSIIKAQKVSKVISSPIEHVSVSRTLNEMASQGVIDLRMVKIDQEGLPDLHHLEQLLKASTHESVLVSLMHGHNEIGSMIDVIKVGQLCKQYHAFFHSDTVQTIGHYALDLSDAPIDLITASAHKFHGPKGTGFLWMKKDLGLHVHQTGGSQENGLRGGTEHVAGIVGLAKAFQLAMEYHDSTQKLLQEIKMLLKVGLEKMGGVVNGMKNGKGLCTILNMGFEENERSQHLTLELDQAGISVGSGSACSGGAPSPVLEFLQTQHRTNIRFSFSRFTTVNQIYRVLSLIEYRLTGTQTLEVALTI